MKTLISMMMAILMAVIVGPAISGFVGVSAGTGVVGMLGLSVVMSIVPMPKGMAFMAVQKEIWQKDIIEALRKDNTFLKYAYNADEYVMQGKVVHIPQSGGGTAVEKNRSTLPATVRKRSDSDITYALDEFTTDPVVIENADQVELSYDKRQSVVGEEREALVERVADEIIYTWAKDLPEANIIATTGSAAAATAPGATGDRKAILRADLQKAQTRMNKDNVPKKGRVCLLSSEMTAQLFPPDDAVTASYMQVVSKEEREMGIIAKMHGFLVMERSSALVYDDAGTLKAPEAASAATDNEGALCYHSYGVERAMGQVAMFDKDKDPQFYGDVVSFLARMGGRRRRSDNKGVVVIRQAAAV